MKKTTVVIFFGGKSTEHEVSIRSARMVFNSLDRKKYDILAVAINKKGIFLSPGQSIDVIKNDVWPLDKNIEKVSISQSEACIVFEDRKIFFDVAFPVMHGPFGEDGTMQGLLKLTAVPFVGPGVLGSAIGMDKDVSKRLLRDAGIPIGLFLSFNKCEINSISFDLCKKKLGLPLFIKPANLGSSVGVFKVHNNVEFDIAIKKAFLFDSKILIEQYIKGREIECAVIGNEELQVSIPGEIVPTHEFYSYDAKYVDENGAILNIPANIPASVVRKIQIISEKTYKVLCCDGMARVDFFLTSKNELYVNEINTIPGFTSVSMFPKLWEASGISNQKLVDILVQLAMDRFKNENKLKLTM
ncbi:MAG: D-alanine--D-alanine ligase family protein [bacterium]